MRAILLSVLASSVFALSSGLGCVPETTSNDDDDQDVQAPDFAEDQGQLTHVEVAYPAGPYGIEVGAIAENYKFIGYPKPHEDQDNYYEIRLSDFYNPTGEGVYPEGSVHGAGEPMPTVLLVVVASVWCGPCNVESDTILPAEYAEYKPLGAEFLLQLQDGGTPGIPAKFSHLKTWTSKYDTQWPAVIDPTAKLGELFEADAFPANILIDTTTMEILDAVAGIPPEGSSFFTKLEAHLKN